MISRLVLVWTACLAVVAASTDKSNGFNSNIDWIAPADLQARRLVTPSRPIKNVKECCNCLDQSGKQHAGVRGREFPTATSP